MIGTITYFSSLTTVQGKRYSVPWALIFERFARPRVCARKEDAPGWSPALFEDDSRAQGKGVLSLGALVVEYDHGVSVADAATTWSAFFGCIYTTHSHTSEAPRCRVVLPLSRPISAEEHGRLWRWAETVGGTIDAKARDAKRFWYLPAHKPGALFQTRDLSGQVLDADAVLRSLPPPAPEPAPAAYTPPVRLPSGVTSAVDRARLYIDKVPGAVSGQGGHAATFTLARALVIGFGLDTTTAFDLLTEWNAQCEPPWSRGELIHKVRSADTTPSSRPRGYLLQRRRAA